MFESNGLINQFTKTQQTLDQNKHLDVTARTGSTQLGLHKPPVLSVPGPWWFNQSTGCQHSPHPPHIHCQHSFAMQGTTREREVSSRAPVLRPAKIFTPPLLHENLTTTILATFNVYLYNPIIYLIRLFFNFFKLTLLIEYLHLTFRYLLSIHVTFSYQFIRLFPAFHTYASIPIPLLLCNWVEEFSPTYTYLY